MKGLSLATAAALVAVGIFGAAAPARADRYVLDFETDAVGNPLAPGEAIADQWADWGVNIDVDRDDNRNHPLLVFNSNCGEYFEVACTGGDEDLASGPDYGTPAQGNVLIIQENNDYSDPDDDASGGDFIFTFDDLVTLDRVNILDVDEGRGGFLKAFGADGNLLKNLDLQSGGDNALLDYLFEDLTEVASLKIRLPGSGAISSIEFTDLPAYEDDSASVPEPTSAIALLALGAIGTGSVLKRKR